MPCPFSFWHSSTAGKTSSPAQSIPAVGVNVYDVGAERYYLKSERQELVCPYILDDTNKEGWVLKAQRDPPTPPADQKPAFSSPSLSPELPPTPPSSLPLTPKFSTSSTFPSSLSVPTYHLSSSTSKTFLQTSPYIDQDHLLDLRTVSTPNRLLACALTVMNPTTPAYSTTPYKSAFNWTDIVSTLRELIHNEGPNYTFPKSNFYIIVFRSRVPQNVNRPRLGELDKEAHREANEAGNLLKYWFGEPNAEGRNLATCIWRDIQDAKKGGKGPGHRLAMQEVVGHYSEWYVERLRLVIGEAAEAWDIMEW